MYQSSLDIPKLSEIEENNDGSRINLLFSPAIAVWLAVGKSAYALRLMLKSLEYDNLRTYSKSLQTPVVIISNDTVERLKAFKSVSYPMGGGIAQLPSQAEFDQSQYRLWVEKLLRESESPIQTHVSTKVSQYVPKEGFIVDHMSSFSRNVKRIGDFFISLIALIVFSPLILLCWLLIKWEDRGPAIFKQERIGRFGKPFNIYKFRTMRLDAEKYGPQLSHSGGGADPRLTKVGRFLRAHHLDELPQLWNVFTGDMAFIGPRPERKFFIDQILEYDKRYTYLYQIRPGVTSYATLYNGYTDTMEKMLRRLEYDLYYLGHRSWLLDFKILIKTFLNILFGKKF